MKIKSLAWIIVIATILLGCGATRPKVEVGRYSFNYEGKIYHIESLTPKSQEGYNFLILKEDDKLLLRALDKEQDGILDKMLSGDISLEKANEIYQQGILLGRTRGQVRKRDFTRLYTTSDRLNNYILKTYILAVGEVYNRLTISSRSISEEETVVLDLDADGNLNKIERGSDNLLHYQNIYKRILDQGMAQGRVVITEGMYQVALN
jgi:hypothetical protein